MTDERVGRDQFAETWRQAMAAELQQTQQALAASQADLTAMERERDEESHNLAHALFELDMTKTRLGHVRAQLTAAKSAATGARQALRNVLIALGLDITDENLQPLMEARRIRAELDRGRPIVEAALAYVTHPERPDVMDPNEAHAWDLEAERRYLVLRDAVTHINKEQ